MEMHHIPALTADLGCSEPKCVEDTSASFAVLNTSSWAFSHTQVVPFFAAGAMVPKNVDESGKYLL